jgi:hypothetical protein
MLTEVTLVTVLCGVFLAYGYSSSLPSGKTNHYRPSRMVWDPKPYTLCWKLTLTEGY